MLKLNECYEAFNLISRRDDHNGGGNVEHSLKIDEEFLGDSGRNLETDIVHFVNYLFTR